MDLLRGKGKMTVFVDVGYLLALEIWRTNNVGLQTDLQKVQAQIKQLIEEGHSVQLHIHPHWEKAKYENGKWNINVDGCYKLSDFEQEEMESIVRKYKAYLDELVGYKTTVFRAGGWCIQPFDRLQKVFEELGLKVDSSVMPGMRYETKHYAYDFSQVQSAKNYRFSSDVCEEDTQGFMTEYPIATMRYSPLFYWQLYGWGRLLPSRHKPIGNGTAIPQPGRKQKILTQRTLHHVSVDGYFAKKLNSAVKHFEKQGLKDLVIIGHPKSMTQYSREQLEKFIKHQYKKHSFVTLGHENH